MSPVGLGNTNFTQTSPDTDMDTGKVDMEKREQEIQEAEVVHS